MAAKYVIKAAGGEQFMFTLKAANGEVILTSELYKQEASAENGIESVRKYAPDDARFERKTAKNGEPYFVLKAGNGEIIGKSEMYSSTSAMEKGIKSVMKNAPVAIIEVKDPVRPIAATSAHDPLTSTRAWLLAMAKEAEAIAPALPADMAMNHDHYAHGKPGP